MKYLDEKLALLNTSLVKENLSRYSLGRLGRGGAWGPFTGTGTGTECPCRVLEALWELLLQAILRALGANLDVSADFYGRFHFTLEVGGGASLLGLPGPCPGHPAMCPRPGGLAFPARTAPLGLPPDQCLLPAGRLCEQHLGHLPRPLSGPRHWQPRLR